MIKVKFIKALYPYKVWEVADIKQNVFDMWDKKGYFERLDIKVDVKVQKVVANKSMEGKKKVNKSL